MGTNEFLRNSLDEWTGASTLGPVSHEYKLVRAAANKDDAAGFPWIMTVQKKMQQVKAIPGAQAAKMTSCARPKQKYAASWCCVRKQITGVDVSTLSVVNQTVLMNVLMKI